MSAPDDQHAAKDALAVWHRRRIRRVLTSSVAAFGLFPFCASVLPGLLPSGVARAGMSLWAAQCLTLLCLLVDERLYRRP